MMIEIDEWYAAALYYFKSLPMPFFVVVDGEQKKIPADWYRKFT